MALGRSSGNVVWPKLSMTKVLEHLGAGEQSAQFFSEIRVGELGLRADGICLALDTLLKMGLHPLLPLLDFPPP